MTLVSSGDLALQAESSRLSKRVRGGYRYYLKQQHLLRPKDFWLDSRGLQSLKE